MAEHYWSSIRPYLQTGSAAGRGREPVIEFVVEVVVVGDELQVVAQVVGRGCGLWAVRDRRDVAAIAVRDGVARDPRPMPPIPSVPR